MAGALVRLFGNSADVGGEKASDVTEQMLTASCCIRGRKFLISIFPPLINLSTEWCLLLFPLLIQASCLPTPTLQYILSRGSGHTNLYQTLQPSSTRFAYFRACVCISKCVCMRDVTDEGCQIKMYSHGSRWEMKVKRSEKRRLIFLLRSPSLLSPLSMCVCAYPLCHMQSIFFLRPSLLLPLCVQCVRVHTFCAMGGKRFGEMRERDVGPGDEKGMRDGGRGLWTVSVCVQRSLTAGTAALRNPCSLSLILPNYSFSPLFHYRPFIPRLLQNHSLLHCHSLLTTCTSLYPCPSISLFSPVICKDSCPKLAAMETTRKRCSCEESSISFLCVCMCVYVLLPLFVPPATTVTLPLASRSLTLLHHCSAPVLWTHKKNEHK